MTTHVRSTIKVHVQKTHHVRPRTLKAKKGSKRKVSVVWYLNKTLMLIRSLILRDRLIVYYLGVTKYILFIPCTNVVYN